MLGDLGAGYYFTPETLQRGADLGVKGGFAWYVVGRGGVLGDADVEVAQSAYAYFEPKLFRKLWSRGVEAIAPRDAGREYAECARRWGRMTFVGVEEAARFADLAARVIDQADSAGMALFAGWKAEPLGSTDDPLGRAAMACNTLRELRGCAHIMAILAVGLTPPVAHFTTGGPDRWKLFGFDIDNPPMPQPGLMAEAEALTDRMTAVAYQVLSAEESTEFVAAVSKLNEARLSAVAAST
jgi:hypothetical protein